MGYVVANRERYRMILNLEFATRKRLRSLGAGLRWVRQGWLVYAVIAIRFGILAVMLWGGVHSPDCLGQPPRPTPASTTGFNSGDASKTTATVQWRTGDDFDQFIKSPVSVSWQNAELRNRLIEFSRSQRIPIVLDRRVDPNQRLDLVVRNVSVEQFLLRVAQRCGCQFCRLGDGYYVGPSENAQRLLAIDSILSRSSKKVSTRWSEVRSAAWEKLATPSQVLQQWLPKNEFSISGIEQIEHDLMAAVDAGALRLDLRLALLLSQFDLWFRQSKTGDAISIVSPPQSLSATLRLEGYEVNAALLQRVRAVAPECNVKKVRRSLLITGPAEQLEMGRNVVIESFQPALRELDKKRFQLNVKNQRRLILQAVAQQLAMEVSVDPKCETALDAVITVEVKDATLNDLLDAIFGDCRCRYAIDGQSINVTPSEAP